MSEKQDLLRKVLDLVESFRQIGESELADQALRFMGRCEERLGLPLDSCFVSASVLVAMRAVR